MTSPLLVASAWDLRVGEQVLTYSHELLLRIKLTIPYGLVWWWRPEQVWEGCVYCKVRQLTEVIDSLLSDYNYITYIISCLLLIIILNNGDNRSS